jgi:hypothetical protein
MNVLTFRFSLWRIKRKKKSVKDELREMKLYNVSF